MPTLIDICSDKWTVSVVRNEKANGGSSFADWLQEMMANKDTKANASGILALFDDLASRDRGPIDISDGLCHAVDKDNGIYQLSKGKLRVLFFHHPTEQKIVIVSHGFMKKTQKTPSAEVDAAIRLRKKFKIGNTK